MLDRYKKIYSKRVVDATLSKQKHIHSKENAPSKYAIGTSALALVDAKDQVQTAVLLVMAFSTAQNIEQEVKKSMPYGICLCAPGAEPRAAGVI